MKGGTWDHQKFKDLQGKGKHSHNNNEKKLEKKKW